MSSSSSAAMAEGSEGSRGAREGGGDGGVAAGKAGDGAAGDAVEEGVGRQVEEVGGVAPWVRKLSEILAEKEEEEDLEADNDNSDRGREERIVDVAAVEQRPEQNAEDAEQRRAGRRLLAVVRKREGSMREAWEALLRAIVNALRGGQVGGDTGDDDEEGQAKAEEERVAQFTATMLAVVARALDGDQTANDRAAFGILEELLLQSDDLFHELASAVFGRVVSWRGGSHPASKGLFLRVLATLRALWTRRPAYVMCAVSQLARALRLNPQKLRHFCTRPDRLRIPFCPAVAAVVGTDASLGVAEGEEIPLAGATPAGGGTAEEETSHWTLNEVQDLTWRVTLAQCMVTLLGHLAGALQPQHVAVQHVLREYVESVLFVGERALSEIWSSTVLRTLKFLAGEQQHLPTSVVRWLYEALAPLSAFPVPQSLQHPGSAQRWRRLLPHMHAVLTAPGTRCEVSAKAIALVNRISIDVPSTTASRSATSRMPTLCATQFVMAKGAHAPTDPFCADMLLRIHAAWALSHRESVLRTILWNCRLVFLCQRQRREQRRKQHRASSQLVPPEFLRMVAFDASVCCMVISTAFHFADCALQNSSPNDKARNPRSKRLGSTPSTRSASSPRFTVRQRECAALASEFLWTALLESRPLDLGVVLAEPLAALAGLLQEHHVLQPPRNVTTAVQRDAALDRLDVLNGLLAQPLCSTAPALTAWQVRALSFLAACLTSQIAAAIHVTPLVGATNPTGGTTIVPPISWESLCARFRSVSARQAVLACSSTHRATAAGNSTPAGYRHALGLMRPTTGVAALHPVTTAMAGSPLAFMCALGATVHDTPRVRNCVFDRLAPSQAISAAIRYAMRPERPLSRPHPRESALESFLAFIVLPARASLAPDVVDDLVRLATDIVPPKLWRRCACRDGGSSRDGHSDRDRDSDPMCVPHTMEDWQQVVALACWDTALALASNKMRSHLGGPTQLFEAIGHALTAYVDTLPLELQQRTEALAQSGMEEVGMHPHVRDVRMMSVRARLVALVHLCFALERITCFGGEGSYAMRAVSRSPGGVYRLLRRSDELESVYAMHSLATDRTLRLPPLPSSATGFFFANQRVCREWLTRVLKPDLFLACILLGAHSAARYHGLAFLEPLAAQAQRASFTLSQQPDNSMSASSPHPTRHGKQEKQSKRGNRHVAGARARLTTPPADAAAESAVELRDAFATWARAEAHCMRCAMVECSVNDHAALRGVLAWREMHVQPLAQQIAQHSGDTRIVQLFDCATGTCFRAFASDCRACFEDALCSFDQWLDFLDTTPLLEAGGAPQSTDFEAVCRAVKDAYLADDMVAWILNWLCVGRRATDPTSLLRAFEHFDTAAETPLATAVGDGSRGGSSSSRDTGDHADCVDDDNEWRQTRAEILSSFAVDGEELQRQPLAGSRPRYPHLPHLHQPPRGSGDRHQGWRVLAQADISRCTRIAARLGFWPFKPDHPVPANVSSQQRAQEVKGLLRQWTFTNDQWVAPSHALQECLSWTLLDAGETDFRSLYTGLALRTEFQEQTSNRKESQGSRLAFAHSEQLTQLESAGLLLHDDGFPASLTVPAKHLIAGLANHRPKTGAQQYLDVVHGARVGLNAGALHSLTGLKRVRLALSTTAASATSLVMEEAKYLVHSPDGTASLMAEPLVARLSTSALCALRRLQSGNFDKAGTVFSVADWDMYKAVSGSGLSTMQLLLSELIDYVGPSGGMGRAMHARTVQPPLCLPELKGQLVPTLQRWQSLDGPRLDLLHAVSQSVPPAVLLCLGDLAQEATVAVELATGTSLPDADTASMCAYAAALRLATEQTPCRLQAFRKLALLEQHRAMEALNLSGAVSGSATRLSTGTAETAAVRDSVEATLVVRMLQDAAFAHSRALSLSNSGPAARYTKGKHVLDSPHTPAVSMLVDILRCGYLSAYAASRRSDASSRTESWWTPHNDVFLSQTCAEGIPLQLWFDVLQQLFDGLKHPSDAVRTWISQLLHKIAAAGAPAALTFHVVAACAPVTLQQQVVQAAAGSTSGSSPGSDGGHVGLGKREVNGMPNIVPDPLVDDRQRMLLSAVREALVHETAASGGKRVAATESFIQHMHAVSLPAEEVALHAWNAVHPLVRDAERGDSGTSNLEYRGAKALRVAADHLERCLPWLLVTPPEESPTPAGSPCFHTVSSSFFIRKFSPAMRACVRSMRSQAISSPAAQACPVVSHNSSTNSSTTAAAAAATSVSVEAHHERLLQFYAALRRALERYVASRRSVYLATCAPQLVEALRAGSGVELPGHVGGKAVPTIGTTAPTCTRVTAVQDRADVLNTLTRPKRITFTSEQGESLVYLVKGREDLSLDARIMTCMRTANALLQDGRLRMRLFNVLPLSSVVGLVEWVDEAVPLYVLYRDYRERRRKLQLQSGQKPVLTTASLSNDCTEAGAGTGAGDGSPKQHNGKGKAKHQKQNGDGSEAEANANGGADAAASAEGTAAAGTTEVETDVGTEAENAAETDNTAAIDRGKGTDLPTSHRKTRDAFTRKLLEVAKRLGEPLHNRRHEWSHRLLRTVFEELQQTEGESRVFLQELMLTTSTHAEFVERQATLQRSYAVSCVLSYLVGLGDRHLDNILLDLASGDVVQVDFNICFDTGQLLRVPELVPFRLTQSIVTLLGGPAGVHGGFRSTCEDVLQHMRDGRSTLEGMLETFVVSPVVDWATRRHVEDDGRGSDETDPITRLAVSCKAIRDAFPAIRCLVQDLSSKRCSCFYAFLRRLHACAALQASVPSFDLSAPLPLGLSSDVPLVTNEYDISHSKMKKRKRRKKKHKSDGGNDNEDGRAGGDGNGDGDGGGDHVEDGDEQQQQNRNAHMKQHEERSSPGKSAVDGLRPETSNWASVVQQSLDSEPKSQPELKESQQLHSPGPAAPQTPSLRSPLSSQVSSRSPEESSPLSEWNPEEQEEAAAANAVRQCELAYQQACATFIDPLGAWCAQIPALSTALFEAQLRHKQMSNPGQVSTWPWDPLAALEQEVHILSDVRERAQEARRTAVQDSAAVVTATPDFTTRAADLTEQAMDLAARAHIVLQDYMGHVRRIATDMAAYAQTVSFDSLWIAALQHRVSASNVALLQKQQQLLLDQSTDEDSPLPVLPKDMAVLLRCWAPQHEQSVPEGDVLLSTDVFQERVVRASTVALTRMYAVVFVRTCVEQQVHHSALSGITATATGTTTDTATGTHASSSDMERDRQLQLSIFNLCADHSRAAELAQAIEQLWSQASASTQGLSLQQVPRSYNDNPMTLSWSQKTLAHWWGCVSTESAGEATTSPTAPSAGTDVAALWGALKELGLMDQQTSAWICDGLQCRALGISLCHQLVTLFIPMGHPERDAFLMALDMSATECSRALLTWLEWSVVTVPTLCYMCVFQDTEDLRKAVCSWMEEVVSMETAVSSATEQAAQAALAVGAAAPRPVASASVATQLGDLMQRMRTALLPRCRATSTAAEDDTARLVMSGDDACIRPLVWALVHGDQLHELQWESVAMPETAETQTEDRSGGDARASGAATASACAAAPLQLGELHARLAMCQTILEQHAFASKDWAAVLQLGTCAASQCAAHILQRMFDVAFGPVLSRAAQASRAAIQVAQNAQSQMSQSVLVDALGEEALLRTASETRTGAAATVDVAAPAPTGDQDVASLLTPAQAACLLRHTGSANATGHTLLASMLRTLTVGETNASALASAMEWVYDAALQYHTRLLQQGQQDYGSPSSSVLLGTTGARTAMLNTLAGIAGEARNLSGMCAELATSAATSDVRHNALSGIVAGCGEALERLGGVPTGVLRLESVRLDMLNDNAQLRATGGQILGLLCRWDHAAAVASHTHIEVRNCVTHVRFAKGQLADVRRRTASLQCQKLFHELLHEMVAYWPNDSATVDGGRTLCHPQSENSVWAALRALAAQLASVSLEHMASLSSSSTATSLSSSEATKDAGGLHLDATGVASSEYSPLQQLHIAAVAARDRLDHTIACLEVCDRVIGVVQEAREKSKTTESPDIRADFFVRLLVAVSKLSSTGRVRPPSSQASDVCGHAAEVLRCADVMSARSATFEALLHLSTACSKVLEVAPATIANLSFVPGSDTAADADVDQEVGADSVFTKELTKFVNASRAKAVSGEHFVGLDKRVREFSQVCRDLTGVDVMEPATPGLAVSLGLACPPPSVQDDLDAAKGGSGGKRNAGSPMGEEEKQKADASRSSVAAAPPPLAKWTWLDPRLKHVSSPDERSGRDDAKSVMGRVANKLSGVVTEVQFESWCLGAKPSVQAAQLPPAPAGAPPPPHMNASVPPPPPPGPPPVPSVGAVRQRDSGRQLNSGTKGSSSPRKRVAFNHRMHASVPDQVAALLAQASNVDNLCEMWEGWTSWV